MLDNVFRYHSRRHDYGIVLKLAVLFLFVAGALYLISKLIGRL